MSGLTSRAEAAVAARSRGRQAARSSIPDAELDINGSGDASSAASVGAALEAALRVRAPEVHSSTPMVRQLAVKIGRDLGFDADARTLLDLCIRVRDVGLIGLPDRIVLATAALSAADWELVNQHPVIGAELLEGLAAVRHTAEIVRAHHERWDGDGYPDGLAGVAIPLLGRVIATCDAFVAMATDRPYRRGMGAEAALEQIRHESGSQFDPRLVNALDVALAGGGASAPAAAAVSDSARVPRKQSVVPGVDGGAGALATAIAEFDVVTAFAPAYERVLALTAVSGSPLGEIVAAIESDTGLTIAVLRRAQGVRAKRPIANVADAVSALGASGVEESIKGLPRAEFPWRTSQLEVLMHRSRVHAQAVMRAADRIVGDTGLPERDDVLVAALLHDIGKLVLNRVIPDYGDRLDARTSTPENRIRHEQRGLDMDHAMLGGILLRRWGLPEPLSRAVATHHSSELESDVATYVRLADMLAHHAQGDAVDRTKMLALCQVCGLSAKSLRDVLFDLPRSGGSQRRRAEPSPLSARQTAVLRLLAEGKVYKIIAQELGLSASTVRTHLHNMYVKLGVQDRAQAVLHATEMGWL